MKPFISIVIPTYKRPVMLERALRSIGSSNIHNFEIIVINDGSGSLYRDEYNRVYKTYSKSLKVLTFENNKGVSSARNKGIEIAKADWILFLDDDDELVSGYLEYLKDFLPLVCDEIGLIWPNIFIKHYRNEQAVRIRKMFLPQTEKQIIFDLLSIGIGYGVLIRKKILEELSGFDVSYSVSEDTDLFFRLLHLGTKVSHINRYGIIIHEHEEKKLTEAFYCHAHKHIFRYLFRQYNKFLKSDVDMYIDFSSWVINVYLRHRMVFSAICMCFEFLVRYPSHIKVWNACVARLHTCLSSTKTRGAYA